MVKDLGSGLPVAVQDVQSLLLEVAKDLWVGPPKITTDRESLGLPNWTKAEHLPKQLLKYQGTKTLLLQKP